MVSFIFISGCVQEKQPLQADSEARAYESENKQIQPPSDGQTLKDEEEDISKQLSNKLPSSTKFEADIDEKPEDFETESWNQRIDAALAPTECRKVTGPRYGNSHYAGTLIDSHYHIPSIPDHAPDGRNPDFTKEVRPYLGGNIKIGDITCTLEQENTSKVFAFFPVYPEIDWQSLEVVKRTMEQYPDRFVPFIMPPHSDNHKDGSPTVDAEMLKEMLDAYSGLFKGYGEIGLYARKGGAAELPPDSPRLLEIYPLIRQHKLVVYFHLGEGHKDNFEKVLEQNPDINFVWHGDQLVKYENGRQNLEDIGDILSKHHNARYTIDELYGDKFMIRPEVTKKEFLKYLENYEELLEKDTATWKEFIEQHPDQVMWGTDRSPQVLWSHDAEIGQALSNYGRAFIARLDPSVQEKFAYRNAEELLKE